MLIERNRTEARKYVKFEMFERGYRVVKMRDIQPEKILVKVAVKSKNLKIDILPTAIQLNSPAIKRGRVCYRTLKKLNKKDESVAVAEFLCTEAPKAINHIEYWIRESPG